MQVSSEIGGRAVIIAFTKLASKVRVNHQPPEIDRLPRFLGTVPLGADLSGTFLSLAVVGALDRVGYATFEGAKKGVWKSELVAFSKPPAVVCFR